MSIKLVTVSSKNPETQKWMRQNYGAAAKEYFERHHASNPLPFGSGLYPDSLVQGKPDKGIINTYHWRVGSGCSPYDDHFKDIWNDLFDVLQKLKAPKSVEMSVLEVISSDPVINMPWKYVPTSSNDLAILALMTGGFVKPYVESNLRWHESSLPGA